MLCEACFSLNLINKRGFLSKKRREMYANCNFDAVSGAIHTDAAWRFVDHKITTSGRKNANERFARPHNNGLIERRMVDWKTNRATRTLTKRNTGV